MHYMELMREIVHRRHQLIVMAPRDGCEEALQKEGIGYRHIPLSRRGANPYKEAASLSAIARGLEDVRPAKLFNFSIKPVIYGSFAARIAGVDQVYSMVTGLGSVFTSEKMGAAIIRGLVIGLYRFTLGNNRVVFFQNEDDLVTFVNAGILRRDQGLVINGTGVNCVDYDFTTRPKDPMTFLLVARLLRDKGIREYCEASKRLKERYPEVNFELLGPFDDNPSAFSRRELKALVGKTGVTYLGEADDVRPYLRRSTVFVLPSYREGRSRAALEALAMGLPIITTDRPGCRETVVDGANGYLVESKNVDSLAAAMEAIIRDPDVVDRMGVESRKIALEKYDVDLVNAGILQSLSL